MLVLNILGDTIKLDYQNLKSVIFVNDANFTGTVYIPKTFLKEKDV